MYEKNYNEALSLNKAGKSKNYCFIKYSEVSKYNKTIL